MDGSQVDTLGTLSVDLSTLQMAAVSGRMAALMGKGGLGQAGRLPEDYPGPLMFAGPVTVSDTSGADGRSRWISGRLGVFLNGLFSIGDRDTTTVEPGFDLTNGGVTAGADYRLWNDLVLGLAFGYYWTSADMFRNSGNVDADGFGLSLYGNYHLGDFYVQGIGTYGHKDYRSTRRVFYSVSDGMGGVTQVDQRFEGATDADELSFSLGTGYDFSIGGFSFGPFLRLDYFHSRIGGYPEALQNPNTLPGYGLALAYDPQELESLATGLGGQATYAINTGVGVFLPFLRAEWDHEFLNDARSILAKFVNGTNYPEAVEENKIIIPTEEPDRDYVNLSAGLSAVFPHGIMAFVDYTVLLGMTYVDLHQITAGARYEF